jgi:dihydrofolate reductase
VVRKVVAYELLSLDGVAEQPDEFVTEFDDVMRENLDRVIATQDAVLLGRRTYDDWAGFWPTSDIEPFASFINGVEKFVVTSTPPENLGQYHGRRWRPGRVRHRAEAAVRR